MAKKKTAPKPYVSPTAKAAKKARITEEAAQRMIVSHHELMLLIPAGGLSTYSLDVSKKTERRLRSIAKQLSISVDAVVMGLLRGLIA